MVQHTCDELCHYFYIEERQNSNAMVTGVSEKLLRTEPVTVLSRRAMIVQKGSDTLGPELSMRDYNHFNCNCNKGKVSILVVRLEVSLNEWGLETACAQVAQPCREQKDTYNLVKHSTHP